MNLVIDKNADVGTCISVTADVDIHFSALSFNSFLFRHTTHRQLNLSEGSDPEKKAKKLCFFEGLLLATLTHAFKILDKVLLCLLPKKVNARKVNLKRNKLLVMAAVLGMWLQLASAAQVSVDLTKFKSGKGVRFHGGASGTFTGIGVAAIGDHNGDGFQDWIFSSPVLLRAVIVMKRNTTYTGMTTESIVSGEFFRVIKGPTGSSMGGSTAGAGDVNGDGFDDVIVGASNGAVSGRTGTPGYAFVIFGMAGPFTDIELTATWAASSLGFMILGAASGAFFSTTRSVRGLGDVNGDGVDDFAVTARFYKLSNDRASAGVVYVIFGKKTPAFTTIDLLPANLGSDGITYVGAEANMRLGFCVMPAGDFNGDGIADFLMGAYEADPVVNGTVRADGGVAYLIHGSPTLASMDMSTFVTGTAGVRFNGPAADVDFGASLSGVGDINDDGLDDIAISAPYADPPTSPARPNAGIVYVIYGTTTVFAADVDMSLFPSFSAGFAIYARSANAYLAAVSPAGDINGDGVNDIVVGGNSANNYLDIVYGQKEVRTAHVDIKTAGVTTFTFTGGATLGYSLDGGKDLNGDGIPDIVVGAYTATVTPESGGSAISSAGAAWMLPGPFILPTDSPTKVPTAAPSRIPSALPTLMPSATPSEMPSMEPSAEPSISPTAVDPTFAPSLAPSAIPSESPSFDPSAAPSMVPTVDPSAAPSMMPSASPSAGPSQNPSAAPSLAPSVIPTVIPSFVPSAVPSVSPTLNPTNAPSVVVTVVPTAVPTFAPSGAPSVVPTIRPTNAADADSELIVNVEQEAYFIEKAKYDAQQAAYNKTIQHTVAEVVNGVTPERVTDIVVEEEEEEGGRRSFRNDAPNSNAASTRPVLLKYKITVHDPTYTMDMLRAELVLAAQEGRMDTALRFYATQFGATGLNNATLAVPQVSGVEESNSSTQLTDWQIALVVIGGVLALLLIIFGVWWRRTKATQTHVLPVVQTQVDEADL